MKLRSKHSPPCTVFLLQIDVNNQKEHFNSYFCHKLLQFLQIRHISSCSTVQFMSLPCQIPSLLPYHSARESTHTHTHTHTSIRPCHLGADRRSVTDRSDRTQSPALSDEKEIPNHAAPASYRQLLQTVSSGACYVNGRRFPAGGPATDACGGEVGAGTEALRDLTL